MTKKRFENKITLITGASSGIGHALSLEMARRGSKVVLAARRKDRLQELTDIINTTGATAIAIACDVTQPEDLSRAVDTAHATFGPIDVAVANAAIPMGGNFETLTLEDYRREMETNVFGVLRTASACLEDLKKTKGVLVIIGSVSGYVSSPGSSAYAMSKFAVRAFAEAVRSELAVHGIAVVLISPGFVQSEIRMIDNQGNFHPEQSDWVSSWMVMSPGRAARKIANAIAKRRRERIITLNGYLGYWFRQYTPFLYFALVDVANRWIRRPKK